LSEALPLNPALNGIWEHIRDLGLGALAHANRHAAYSAMENPRWPELSVVQAAHAAELLVKARIAQEHPLLIFEQLPRFNQASNATLALEDLFKLGRTVQWSELPDRLWASTGISLQNKATFDDFGKLRNGIQHFGPPPDKNAGEETLRFIFGVVDPFINQCWDLFAIDYDEDYEPYVYFVEALVSRDIQFLVSPAAAAQFNNWEVDWSQVSDEYRDVMHHRVEAAKIPKSVSSD
jgi:hypothetical protein